MLTLGAAACGEGGNSQSAEPVAVVEDSEEGKEATTAGVEDGDTPAQLLALGGGAHPPDPCTLLTREDAEELLAEPVGEGRAYDIAGYNCSYDASASGRRLSLIMYLGRDATPEGSQAGISLEHCKAKVVERLDNLGLAAALYQDTAEQCSANLKLWVATGIEFTGSEPPTDRLRVLSGHIQLVLVLSPSQGPEETLPILRPAAQRIVSRLEAQAH